MKIRVLSQKSPLISAVLSCAFALTNVSAFAQHDTTLNQPNQTGTFVAPHTIVLGPGFSSSGPFSASIDPSLANCTAMNLSLSNNQNYIVTYTPRVAGVGNPADPNNTTCQVMASIQYFDGLGRPLQNVQAKSSPAFKDVIQSFVYDAFGRPSVQYQPYVAVGLPSDGSYKSGDPDALVKAFYNPASPGAPAIATTSFPYAVTQFEASPLNRIVQQGAPGADWQPGQGHMVQTAYGTNSSNEVKLWNVTSSGADGSAFYQPGTLYKYVTTDENGNNKVEFKDLQNKTVLKQSQGDNGYLNTYYVFDDLDNLSYVIPPIPSGVTLPASFTENDAIFKNFVYGFHYDGRKRLIEKKMPGKDWEYSVYNKIDQVVMTQDPLQRAKTNQEWTVTKYDALGRIIMTATYTHSGSTPNTSYRTYMQGQVDGQTAQWDNRDNSALGYNVTTYPSSWSTALSINYYDDYNFPGGNPYPFAGGSNMIHSLLTGSKTKVLNNTTGTADMLWVVNYYDDKGQVTQQYNQNYLGGSVLAGNYDEIVNGYDFLGNIINTQRKNYANSSLALTIVNEFKYDHANRKTEAWETINNGTRTLLAQLNYNEIGQLIDKKLHSTDGSNFAQSVDYRYNERGWLKSINNAALTNDNGVTNDDNTDIYGEQITYNDHSDPSKRLYDGNISGISWQTKVPSGMGMPQLQQSFTYSFDKLSRITLADYTTAGQAGKFNEAFTYDDLGNILTLTRKNNVAGYLNNYTYNYIANSERSNKVWGIADSGTALENNSYDYDVNGNMKTDTRKGVTIDYNYINLPQTITKGSSQLNYIYDASGRKLRKVLGTYARDYVNGIEYNNGAIEFVQTTEGRAIPGSQYSYEYMLKDHLGTVKAIVKQDGSILAIQDYYAFGSDMNTGNSLTPSPDNRYKFNGIEQNKELGMDNYDAFFRSLDPKIGRWTSLDPKADYSVSPYVAMNNNPVLHSDFLGDTIQITFHTGFLGLGKKHTVTYTNGNLTENGSAYAGKTPGSLKDKVTALDAIRTGGTDGAQLISNLQNGKTFNLASDSYNHTDPNGKEVSWNSSETNENQPNADGTKGRPSYVGLAHELGHEWDIQQNGRANFGTWYTPTGSKDAVTNSDKIATWWENKIRAENHLGLRTNYSFIDPGNGGQWTPDPAGGVLLFPGTRTSAVNNANGTAINTVPQSTTPNTSNYTYKP